MAQGWIWTCTLPMETSQSRADQALLRLYQDGSGIFESGNGAEAPPLSRNQIQRLIEEQRVTLEGLPISASSRLTPGSTVRIEIPAPRSLEIVPEDRPIPVLYEDDHLVVINKPQGLTVHPSETQSEGTLVHALLHQIRNLSGIGGVLRPGIVHRLDKNTSGAMVVSKTDVAHQRLVEIFSAHQLERRYWALCHGRFNCPSRIESTLGRNPSDRKKMAMNVWDGKKAITHVRALGHYGAHACWIEATLETGRTHQVRVHLTAHGNSLLGDPVYGTPTSKNTKWLALPEKARSLIHTLPGQALHARVLGFQHPITGQELRFEAEPPAVFVALQKALDPSA
jgi:23S rRNA pseudouridine1911/1915/1917 synthase